MNDEIRKPSFLVYYDNEVIVLRLSDDEAGKLFKSLFPYGKEEIKPDFDSSPALAMAFDILSMAIDRDKEKYTRRCEANRENGRKGGRPKKNQPDIAETQKSEWLDLKLKKTDKDRDRDKDRDKDMDSINTSCPEPDKPSPDLSGIKLPLNDKSFYDVPLDKIALWKETYQAVDIEQELKKMAAWLDSNPTRRKTRRGIPKFINGWLSRQQDSGRNYKASGQYQDGRQQACKGGKAAYSAEEQAMYDKYLGKGDIPGADEIWG